MQVDGRNFFAGKRDFLDRFAKHLHMIFLIIGDTQMTQSPSPIFLFCHQGRSGGAGLVSSSLAEYDEAGEINRKEEKTSVTVSLKLF
jgi:hypothetical protein